MGHPEHQHQPLQQSTGEHEPTNTPSNRSSTSTNPRSKAQASTNPPVGRCQRQTTAIHSSRLPNQEGTLRLQTTAPSNRNSTAWGDQRQQPAAAGTNTKPQN